MFCIRCGNKVVDNAKICHVCGENLKADSITNCNQIFQNEVDCEKTVNKNRQNKDYDNTSPQNNQLDYTTLRHNQARRNQPQYCQQSNVILTSKQYDSSCSPRHSMAWYKFSIYFLLIVQAISGFIYAYLYFTGNVHSTVRFSGDNILIITSKLTYINYDGLKTVDIILAICFLVQGFFGFKVRDALKNRYMYPKRYIGTMYALRFIITFITIAGYSLCGCGELLGEPLYIFFSLAVHAVIMCLELVYYGNREDYFIY